MNALAIFTEDNDVAPPGTGRRTPLAGIVNSMSSRRGWASGRQLLATRPVAKPIQRPYGGRAPRAAAIECARHFGGVGSRATP